MVLYLNSQVIDTKINKITGKKRIKKFFDENSHFFNSRRMITSKEELLQKIKSLFLSGNRGIYIWDEMVKVAEMFFIIEKSPYNPPIIDLCCGYGYWVSKVFDHIDVGVDLFPKTGRWKRTIKGFVERNFIDNTYLAVLKADVSKVLPFRSEYFNTALCICSLEHMELEDIKSTLKEAYRILAPKGRLILTVQTNLYEKRFKKFFSQDFWKKVNKLSEYRSLLSYRQWKRLLERTGFNIKTTQGFMDDLRTFLWGVGFYPNGYQNWIGMLNIDQTIRENEHLVNLWIFKTIPCLTKKVSPSEASLLCFECEK